jgi:hypothetical protein
MLIHRGVDFMECSSNSLTENSETNLVVYPNPWEQHSDLHITGIISKTSYQLINAQGQIVLSGVLNADHSEIKSTELSRGIYFLKLENGNRTIRIALD